MADRKLRQAIAAEAARLLQQRKEPDYHAARRKAARWFSRQRVARADLPSYGEIQQEVFALAGLFSSERQQSALNEIRLIARELLDLLSDFEPRLSGSALTGPILPGAEIELVLGHGDVSDVSAVLFDAGHRVQVRSDGSLTFYDRYPCVVTLAVDSPAVEPDAARRRLGLADLDTLLAAESARDMLRKEAHARSSESDSDDDEDGYHPDFFPTLEMLLNSLESIRLDPIHHPEGDLLYHSLQVYELGLAERPNDEEFLLACLLHDVGVGLDRRHPLEAAWNAIGELVTPRTWFFIENRAEAVEYLSTGRIRGTLRRSEDFEELVLLGKRTSIVYDADALRIADVNALGARTTQIFDAAGQLQAVRNANDARTTFTYDGTGQRTQLIDPLNRRTTWIYDVDARQTGRVDVRNNRTTYLYDANGGLTARCYPDGSRVTFSLDITGLRVKMQDATGRTTYTYDSLSRMQSLVAAPSRRMTMTYEPNGQRQTVSAPNGGRFTTCYDADGNLQILIRPNQGRTTYAYDAAGHRTAERLPTGMRTSFNYDDAGQTTRISHQDTGGAILGSFDYGYDDVGNRARVREANNDRVTWVYDAANQLEAERRSGADAYANTFTYDSMGNRTLLQADGQRTTTTYDRANQLRYSEAAAGRTTYTFDANGNQQIVREPTGGITTTVWDYENQPKLIQLPTGGRVRTGASTTVGIR